MIRDTLTVARCVVRIAFWAPIYFVCLAIASCTGSDGTLLTPEGDEPSVFAPDPDEPSETPPELGTTAAEYIGAVGTDEPLTFWWYAGDPKVLRPTIECALERIRDAACLPVDVSLDAAHWVRQDTPANMGTLWGRTTGAFDSARIRLRDPLSWENNCNVLVHEIGQHILRRSNGHVGAQDHLDATLLESICTARDCGCFIPEVVPEP